MSAPTYFAPAERISSEELARQSTLVASEVQTLSVFEAFRDVGVVILNPQRQILYCNTAFTTITNQNPGSDISGLRPGEAIGCDNADRMEHGCGTSRECSFCGVTGAILESLETESTSRKICRITTSNSGRPLSYEFNISATPLTLNNETFVLMIVHDISDQKRRIALERIFFHDILNKASSIQIMADLIRRTPGSADLSHLLDNLKDVTDILVDEINSQKILVSAENGTLKTEMHIISAVSFIDGIVKSFVHHEIARDKTIRTEHVSPEVVIMSDQAILGRVVTNMVKNGLEAAPPDSKITIGCTNTKGNITIWVHNPGYMEEGIQLQIFQRSFSTKGHDRGLGTYSMKLLTEQYLDGRIRFSSTQEEGTCFSVILPADPSSLSVPLNAPAKPG